MSAFDDFADKALDLLDRAVYVNVPHFVLEYVWNTEAARLSDKEGYTLRPDDPRYPQDRIAIEDAVMDQFGYDPDWREA